MPPNLDSDYWELKGTTSLTRGFYVVYPAAAGTIYYRRFDTYLLGYLISIAALMGLVVWYKKEWLLGKYRTLRRAWG